MANGTANGTTQSGGDEAFHRAGLESQLNCPRCHVTIERDPRPNDEWRTFSYSEYHAAVELPAYPGYTMFVAECDEHHRLGYADREEFVAASQRGDLDPAVSADMERLLAVHDAEEAL